MILLTLNVKGSMRRLLLVLALFGCKAKNETSSASASSSAPTTVHFPTSSCGEEVVTDEGIGTLRIGATVESIKQKCNVLRDTTVSGPEGMPARKLAVAFSRDTVDVEIVDGRVWRIAVHSPGLRTASLIGVGTLNQRLQTLKDPHGAMGEGALFVLTPQHCGMSFRLANAGPRGMRGDLDKAGLRSLPIEAMVSEVLVFGCHR
jgi:hypothetical protein